MSITCLEDSTVFVTGGTGFIGSHLVGRLLKEGARAHVLVRDRANIGRLEPYRHQLSLVEGDIRQADSLVVGENLKPEIVFHLAAYGAEGPRNSVSDAIDVNVRGLCNLLTLFSGDAGEKLRAFLCTGTDFEYGIGDGPRSETDELSPPNYYAASKSAAWHFCQAFHEMNGVPVVGVRPFFVYGPNHGVRRLIPYTIIKALSGEDIRLTGCTQVRDFILVSDVVDGMLRAATTPTAIGQVFNIGSGVGVPLRTAIERIIKLTGAMSRPLFGSIPYRKGEIWDLRANPSKSQQVLGWSAKTSLDDGLKQTIAWYRENVSCMGVG